MSYFDAEPEHVLEPEGREPQHLEGRVEVRDLALVTGDGIRLLEGINFRLEPGEHLALVGFSGSGKSTLALCIGQLYSYTAGRVLLGGAEVSTLSKREVVGSAGFVSQSPYIFDGTIEENLLYACAALRDDGRGAAPVGGMPSLDDQIQVLHQTGLFLDTLRFGLNTILARDARPELVEQLIRVRSNFQQSYGKALADYVEFFHEDHYLYYSSVLENLLFGAPVAFEADAGGFATDPFFVRFLKKADLMRPLIELGGDLTRQTVNILGNLTPDAVFFEQSPIPAEELEAYKALQERIRKQRQHQLAPGDRRMLLDLALRFAPGRHKMVSLPNILERLLLEGRALFREMTEQENPGAFAFYEASRYIHSQTILNNIFFGKPKTASTKTQDKILQSIVQLLIREDLLETIVQIGMQFQVGSKGDRLSGGQRQKLAIGRAFLKSPPLLIMDEATSALDNRSQARIQNLLETRLKGRTTVIAVVHRLDIVKNYDQVAVMKAGKIIEMGRYDELVARKGALYELTSGRA
jgi:ABC-type multidrug transport system ATPase subunit